MIPFSVFSVHLLILCLKQTRISNLKRSIEKKSYLPQSFNRILLAQEIKSLSQTRKGFSQYSTHLYSSAARFPDFSESSIFSIKKIVNNSISMMKGRCLLLLRYLQNGVGCFLLYELYLFFWNEWYIKQYMCVYLFVLDFVSVCIYNKAEPASELRRPIDLPAWFQEFWPQPEWKPCITYLRLSPLLGHRPPRRILYPSKSF